MEEDMIDLTELDRDALAALVVAAQDEMHRRDAVDRIPGEIENLTRALADALGRRDGMAWQPSAGGHDVTPVGWTVVHRGRIWEALALTHVEPGDPDIPDAIMDQVWIDRGPADGDPEPVAAEPWNPAGTYEAGDRVEFEGRIYRCVQGHTAQPGWTPALVPALWADEGVAG